MTDHTALTQLRLMPAHQLAVGMQVLCAIAEPSDPDASLTAEFDRHLEAGTVFVDPDVIASPVQWGYQRRDVAVQLLATISHIETNNGVVDMVLGGGTDTDFAVRLYTTTARVRAIAAASA